MADIGSPEELASLIEGKSDDEINAGVAERGTEKVLTQIFEGWAARFNPDRAGGQSAVIGFDITSPEGTHQYQLKVARPRHDGPRRARPPPPRHRQARRDAGLHDRQAQALRRHDVRPEHAGLVHPVALAKASPSAQMVRRTSYGGSLGGPSE